MLQGERKSREQMRVERDFITGGTGQLVARRGVDAAASAAEGAPDARSAWIQWLAPRFGTGSAYFTGTYTDDYGLAYGCTLPRNVHRDFRRFLVERSLTGHEFITGVERHRYRDVLHLHAVIAGEFSDVERELLKAEWTVTRGFARVLPVLDGCASYVTKYAMKGDTESFDWNLA